ncbi:MAG: VWA domain-containing protein [Spirochaetales bacterium]|nr:VWA domain-containing protein [Spirochaetales bacterium]
MKRIGLLCLFLVLFSHAFGDDLEVRPDDLYIEQGVDGGYHLYIRNKPGLESVLLTESTADPAWKGTSYSLRNPSYHPVNGDELRKLDGEFIDPARKLYSLIDSTPEPNSRFGEAFHIYIPYIVVYGYSWTRSGEIQVLDGTYLSIRTFRFPYADYDGGFIDNPFILRVTQKPLAGPPEENYMEDTLVAYREIAEDGRGEVFLSKGEEDLLNQIGEILGAVEGEAVDFVLALDTTDSMTNDIPHLRESLVPLLEDKLSRFSAARIGMVLYKDYFEEYITKIVPFGLSLADVQKSLDNIRVWGGRDIPEAVYEALFEGIHGFPWEADNRLLILVGDAPPHPRPRGSVTGEDVARDAEALGITIHTIILPQ